MAQTGVKGELRETVGLLLEAMRAEERVRELDPGVSALEAREVLGKALELRGRALRRFKVMCWRLAIACK
jgi:hypothetical protein